MTPNRFRNVMVLLCFIAIVLLISLIYLVVSKKDVQCLVQAPPAPQIVTTSTSCPVPVNRDRRVMNDPMYPPLNRSDKETMEFVVDKVNRGQLYMNPNDSRDEFRLVGYLSSTSGVPDAGNNNWKLMARMRDRQQGEYYIIPSNNNIDLKIPLTSDTVIGQRLRDVYTLPKEMRFNSPMLNSSTYVFTEIPKSDFSSYKYY